MHVHELGQVCLENVLVHLSPYDDLLQCKLVCRLWCGVARDTVKRLKREFRKALLSRDLVSHEIVAKRNEITPRCSHSACVFEGLLYVFGGSTKDKNLFNDLWTFSLSKKKWHRPQTLGQYPSPRARASMLEYKRKLLLFGGQSVTRYAFGRETWKMFNELYQFDVSEACWEMVPTTNAGPSLSSHSACLSGDRMIVFGGLTLAENRSLVSSNQLWILDINARTWTEIETPSPRPSPRFGHSFIPLDQHHFLMLGGCSEHMTMNDVWVLKLIGQTGVWTTLMVRQTDAIPLQPKLHLNPVCKVSQDQLMVLNFRQGPGHGAKSRSSVPSHVEEHNYTHSPARPAVCLHFLDISTALNCGTVTWRPSVATGLTAPDNLVLYSLHLTEYEAVLFGGMIDPERTGNQSNGSPEVTNNLLVFSGRKEVS